MAYTESPQQTFHSSINYNEGAGTLVDTYVGFPIELVALGFEVGTAFVTTTSLKIRLDYSDTAQAVTTGDTTITIPTAAVVGAVYINRLGTTIRVHPGGFFRMAVATAGVGSAGAGRAFVIWKYAPAPDQSNLTVVTA